MTHRSFGATLCICFFLCLVFFKSGVCVCVVCVRAECVLCCVCPSHYCHIGAPVAAMPSRGHKVVTWQSRSRFVFMELKGCKFFIYKGALRERERISE